MKYLLLLLFLSSCASIIPVDSTYYSHEEKVVHCTDRFLNKNLSGKTSYSICKDIYKRKD